MRVARQWGTRGDTEEQEEEEESDQHAEAEGVGLRYKGEGGARGSRGGRYPGISEMGGVVHMYHLHVLHSPYY